MRGILRLAAMANLNLNLKLTPNPNPIKSVRLAQLAQQLRLYSPPPSESDDDVDARGKVFSPLGVGVGVADDSNAQALPRHKTKTAAVLICLFEDASGDLRVLLTKRSSNLSSHSGEVSLPGGKTDDADRDHQDTALREALEEIGLQPSLLSVVTVLQPFISKHLLRVTPVVAILHDIHAFKPALNPAEVEDLFDAPLEMFLEEEKKVSEEREWMGVKYLVHFFDYQMGDKKFLIWGMTAAILIRAASVVYQRPPSFQEQTPHFRLPFP